MRTMRSTIAVCCVASVFLLGVSVTGLGAQAPGAARATPPSEGSGPYKAVMEMDARLPGYTVYRPKDLSALGRHSLTDRPVG